MGDRTLSDEDIKAIGDAVASSLLKILSSDEAASTIMTQWEKWVDIKIGRGVRKIAITVILVLLAAAATKFDLWGKLIPK